MCGCLCGEIRIEGEKKFRGREKYLRGAAVSYLEWPHFSKAALIGFLLFPPFPALLRAVPRKNGTMSMNSFLLPDYCSTFSCKTGQIKKSLSYFGEKEENSFLWRNGIREAQILFVRRPPPLIPPRSHRGERK